MTAAHIKEMHVAVAGAEGKTHRLVAWSSAGVLGEGAPGNGAEALHRFRVSSVPADAPAGFWPGSGAPGSMRAVAAVIASPATPSGADRP